MSAWVLSIIGVVFIGVVFDIVLPEGKTNGFIKSIFSIFVLFVIVSPIPKFINKDFSFNKNSISVDKSFVEDVNVLKVKALEKDIENLLFENGFKNVKVTICYNLAKNDVLVEKVNVDIKNMVLSENLNHINKYNEIVKIILTKVNVEKGNIVFNE